MSTDNTVNGVNSGPTRKRQVRNEVERRRKDKINGWILRIAELLPETIPEKQSKNKILEQAVEYIKYLSNAKEKLLLENSCDVQADEIRNLKKRIKHLEEENANYLRLLKKSRTSSSAFPKKLWESPGKYTNKLSTEQANALLQSFEHKSSSGDSLCHSKLDTLQASARPEKTALHCPQSRRSSEVECDKPVSNKETSEISSVSDTQKNVDVSTNAETDDHNVPTSECTMCEKTCSDTSHTFISTVSTQNACSSPYSTSGDSQGNTFSHASAFASKFSTSLGVGGVTQALPQIPVMSTCQNFSVVQNYNEKSQQSPTTKQSVCSTTVSASNGCGNSDQSVVHKTTGTAHVTEIPNTVNAVDIPPAVTTSPIHTLHSVEQSDSILQQSSAQNCINISPVNTSNTSTVLLPGNSAQTSSLHNELIISNAGQAKNNIISFLPNGNLQQKDNKMTNPSVMSYQLVAQQPLSLLAPKESLNINSEMHLSSQVTENIFVVRFLSQPSSVIPGQLHSINNIPNNYSIFANNAVCHPVINNGVIVEKPFIINTGNNAVLTAMESVQPHQSFPSALLLPGGQIIPVVSKATVMSVSQPTIPNNILVASTNLQGTNHVANSQEITMSSLPLTNIPASSLNMPCATSTRITVTSSGTPLCEHLTSVNALQRPHIPNASSCGKDLECTLPGSVPSTAAITQSAVNSTCGTKRPQEEQSSYALNASSVHGLLASSPESVSVSQCAISTNESTNNSLNKSQPHSKKQCTSDRTKQISVQKGSRKPPQRPLKPKCPANINSIPPSSVDENSNFLPLSQSEQLPVTKTLPSKHSLSNVVTCASSISSSLGSFPASSSISALNVTDTVSSAKTSNDILAKATRSIFSNGTSDLSPSLSALPGHDEALCSVDRNLEHNEQATAFLNKTSCNSVEISKENLSQITQVQRNNATSTSPSMVIVPQITKESLSNQQISDKSASDGDRPSDDKSYNQYSSNGGVNCNTATQDDSDDQNRKATITLDASEPHPKKIKLNEIPEKGFTCDINSEVLECGGSNSEKLPESPKHNNFANCTSSQNTVSVSVTKTSCLQQNANTNEHTVSLPSTTASSIGENQKDSTSVSTSMPLSLPPVEQQHMLRENTAVNVCTSNEHGSVSSHEISNLFLSGISDSANNVQGSSNCDISFLTLSPAEPFDSSLSSKDASEANFSSASLLDNSEATCNQVVENCQSEKFKQFPPHEIKDLSGNKGEKNESSKSDSSVISLNNVILPATSTSSICATAGINLPSHLSSPTVQFSSTLLKSNDSHSEGINQEHCKVKEGISAPPAICTTSEFPNVMTQVNHNLSAHVTSSDGKPSNMACTAPSLSGNMYNFSSPNLVADLTLQLSKHISSANFVPPKSSNSSLPLLSSNAPLENQRYFEYSPAQQTSKHMERATFPQKSLYSPCVPRPSSDSTLPCSDYSTNALITSQSFGESIILPNGIPGTQLNSSRSDVVNKHCETENQLFPVSLTTCSVVNRPSIYSAENLIQTQSTNHKKDREDISNATFSNTVGTKEGRQFSSVYILGNNSTLPSNEKSNDTVSQCVPLLMTPPSLGSSSFTSYVNSNPSVHVSNIAFSVHNGVQPISSTPSLLNCHGGSSSTLAKDSISSSQEVPHLSVRNQIHGVMDDQAKLPRTYPNIPGSTRGMSIPTTSGSLHQSKTNLPASQASQSNSMCFQHLPHTEVSSRIPPQNSHFGHERTTSISVSSMSDPTFSLFSCVQSFQPEGPRSQKNINRTVVSTNFPENNSNIFLNSMVQEVGPNINQGIKPAIPEQSLHSHSSLANQARTNSTKLNKSKKDKQNVNSEEAVAAPPPVFSGSRNPVMTSYFPFHEVPTCKNDSIHNSTHCFSTCQRPFVVSAATSSIHKQPSINAAGIVAPSSDITASPQHNSSCCPRSDTLSLAFQTPSFNVNTLHRVPTTTAPPPPPPPPPPTCSSLPSQISTHNAPRPVPNFNLSNIFPDINTSTEVISLSPMKFHPPSHIFPPTPQLRGQPPSLQSSSSHHSAHQNCGLYPAQPHPPVIHNSFNNIIGPAPHGFDTRSPVQMTGAVAQPVGPHPSSFGPTHTPSFGNVLHTLNFSMQDR